MPRYWLRSLSSSESLWRNVEKESDEEGGAAQELSRWPCEWRQFRLKREVSFSPPPAQPAERPVNPIFGALLATFRAQNNRSSWNPMCREPRIELERVCRRLPLRKFNSDAASHLIWTSYLYLLRRSHSCVAADCHIERGKELKWEWPELCNLLLSVLLYP